MPHKQIDVAIAAFNQLRLPLVVVGDGPACRRAAPPGRARRSSFAGRLSDAAVAEVLQRRAARWSSPSVEEFGIAAVESQAAGRPVIARRGGGALETVDRGRHRLLLVRRRRRSWPRPCWASTTPRSTPRPASRNAARFDAARVPPRDPAREVAAAPRPAAPGSWRPAAAGLDPAGEARGPRLATADGRRVAPGRAHRRSARVLLGGADRAGVLQRRLLRRAARAGPGSGRGLLRRSSALVAGAGRCRAARARWLAIGGLALLAAWTLLSIAVGADRRQRLPRRPDRRALPRARCSRRRCCCARRALPRWSSRRWPPAR